MSKHTPGPWEVVVDIRHQGGEEEYVAGFDIIGPEGVSVVGCEGIYGGSAMERANAELISTAPQLLIALEDALPFLKELSAHAPKLSQRVIAYENLIAKAKGE